MAFDGEDDSATLKEICRDVRRDILTMVYTASSGHIGGSFSGVELLVTLFYSVLHHDPKNPNDDSRDRFILSKGHCTPLYYSVLAKTGYIDQEELSNFRKIGSKLQGHPDKSKFDLMETSSGSLGQGVSIAAGKTFALRMNNNPARVYCMLGDGELDEGQVWEAFATITKYRLSNLIIIVDDNNIQLDGTTKSVKDLEPLHDKFKSFGFDVIEVDGHNIDEVKSAYNYAISLSEKGKNTILLAHTIKGKGVSFMEDTSEWHGKAPNKEEYERAMRELV